MTNDEFVERKMHEVPQNRQKDFKELSAAVGYDSTRMQCIAKALRFGIEREYLESLIVLGSTKALQNGVLDYIQKYNLKCVML